MGYDFVNQWEFFPPAAALAAAIAYLMQISCSEAAAAAVAKQQVDENAFDQISALIKFLHLRISATKLSNLHYSPCPPTWD